MEPAYTIPILAILAFLVTSAVYPFILGYAHKHKIEDKPNTRKLQRSPVAVLGGLTIYIGILVAGIVALILSGDARIVGILIFCGIMFCVGTWDDRKDISPYLRFLIEFLLTWFIIFFLKIEINDFHGFLGLHGIPDVVSTPLSLIAGVGIINAINLIDGVDGYCSSYGAVACTFFSIIFYYSGDMVMFTIALIAVGALLPFFFHNVFGKTSKMFLGDGGSLMLGTLLSIFMFHTLCKDSSCAVLDSSGISLVAVTLAILAVPVFDTLRVMIARVFGGYSPFRPDKTHLHHIFIEMDFSHVATSMLIILGNAMIVVIEFVSWKLGASVNLQVAIVVIFALLFTCGFYYFVKEQQKKNNGEGSKVYKKLCHMGKKTHFSNKPLWIFIRKIVDSPLLGRRIPNSEKGTQPKEKVRIDPRIQ